MKDIKILIAFVVAFGGLWIIGGNLITRIVPSNSSVTVEESTNVLTSVVRTLPDEGGIVYLADKKRGMSLYTTTLEECVGDCLRIWPPYVAEEELLNNTGKLGTVRRFDINSFQYTWEGKPLHFYVEDKISGDTKGHEVNDIWFLARP